MDRGDQAAPQQSDRARHQGAPSDEWNASGVRQLRGYLGDTQSQFADRLGTRQQTVSEWETGSSKPRRIARRLLHMVAEERGYYNIETREAGTDGEPPGAGAGAPEERGGAGGGHPDAAS